MVIHLKHSNTDTQSGTGGLAIATLVSRGGLLDKLE